MVPLKYNLRSLRARKVGSLMTILGVGMVVWASIFAMGLYAGMEHALNIGVNQLDIIVLRQGSTSETASGVSDEAAKLIITLPGIATDNDAKPLAAPELVVIGYLPRRERRAVLIGGNARQGENLARHRVTDGARRFGRRALAQDHHVERIRRDFQRVFQSRVEAKREDARHHHDRRDENRQHRADLAGP